MTNTITTTTTAIKRTAAPATAAPIIAVVLNPPVLPELAALLSDPAEEALEPDNDKVAAKVLVVVVVVTDIGSAGPLGHVYCITPRVQPVCPIEIRVQFVQLNSEHRFKLTLFPSSLQFKDCFK